MEGSLISRHDLAERLGVHVATISTMLRRWPDFPVAERGSHGRPYMFDEEQAVAFVQAKHAEEQERAEERERALEAASPLELGGARKPSVDIGLDDQIKAVKLRKLQRGALVDEGALLPTHEVRINLERAFRRLGTSLDSAIDRVVRRHNLPEAVKRSLEQEFADTRTAFVQGTAAALRSGEDLEPAS